MTSTTSDWIDIQVTTSLDAGELLALLDDPAVQGAWQDDQAIHLYWSAGCWTPDHLARLKRALQQLEGPDKSFPEIQVQSLPHQDWNRLWARSVKPLRIGSRIVIRPSWEEVAVRPGQIEIMLDPRQAFGTGHHATTGMLLEWLDEHIRGGESVLDVGTGSGLLAMVALRLGAACAVGIDNDPVAIDCAREYAQWNRFGSELTLRCDTLENEQPCDLVLANLDRQTLILLADKLAGSTKSRLVVSGLLLDQRQEIVAAFATAGLYPSGERERDGWLAMELTRAQACEGGSE